MSVQDSDADLPLCSPFSVCGKIDTYGSPWMEKQCRCGGSSSSSSSSCSTSTHLHDGHTVQDRTKQYKVSWNNTDKYLWSEAVRAKIKIVLPAIKVNTLDLDNFHSFDVGQLRKFEIFLTDFALSLLVKKYPS